MAPPPIWFTTDELLDVARAFKGWQYRFQLKGPGGTAAPGVTYPDFFLDKYGALFGSQLAGYRERFGKETRATNCVMFGEGLLMGAAARWNKGVSWGKDSHALAMQAAGKGPKGVIQAYVDAGLGDKVYDGKRQTPFPWSIVQGDHHFWIVVDFDPTSGRALTLEANVFIAPLSGGEKGFVGHNWSGIKGQKIQLPTKEMAWGKPLDTEFLQTGTVLGFKERGPKWSDTQDNNKELYFARLFVREPTRVFSPLAPTDKTSAVISGYSNNERAETGHGGYYVFGLHRNLHGGVHLFPPKPEAGGTTAPVGGTPPTRVVAIAPGYVVAARLPGPKSKAFDTNVLDLLQNWPGFVLVRHELTLQPMDREPKPEEKFTRYPLYSLYMHLASPQFYEAPEGNPREIHVEGGDIHLQRRGDAPDVPWFHHLYEARYGSWVRVRTHRKTEEDPGGPLGEMFWSAEPIKEGAKPTACRVHGRQKALIVREGDVPIFVHKPPPAKLVEALRDLYDGNVVTFAEPYFRVKGYDGLGFISSLDVRTKQSAKPGTGVQVPSGFLHFQVFTPDGTTDAIDVLERKLGEIIETFSFKPIDGTAGTFLSNAVFKDKVSSAMMSPEDKTALAEVFRDLESKPDLHFVDATHVVEMLDGHTSFAPEITKRAGSDEHFDWKLDGHVYPVRLDLDVPYLPPVDKHTKAKGAGGYDLHFEFRDANGVPIPCKSRGQDAETRIHIDDALLLKAKTSKKLSVWIQVPAAAESVVITDAVGDVDAAPTAEAADSEEMLFKDMVQGHRWRDVKLTYANEWSIKEMDAAVDAIKASIDKDESYRIDKKHAQQLAWCDPKKETPAPRVRLKSGPTSPPKLFETDLPPTKPLVCLHPMTAVWLLAMLGRNDPPKEKGREREKVAIERSFDSSEHGKDPPKWWAFVGEEGTDPASVKSGDRLWVLAIDDDHGYDAHRKLEVEFDVGGKKPKLELDYDGTRSGAAKYEIVVDYWGACALGGARGGQADPVEKGVAKSQGDAAPVHVPWSDDEIARGFAKTRRRLHGYCFALKFQETPPAIVNGYVWIQYSPAGKAAWKDGPTYELAQAKSFAVGLAQTKAARRKKDKKGNVIGPALDMNTADFEVVEEGGHTYLKCPKDPKKNPSVTPSFSWKTYLAADTDIWLAGTFASELERLSEKLKEQGLSLSLKRLEPDGVTCLVAVTRKGKAKKGGPTPSELCKDAATGFDATVKDALQVELKLATSPGAVPALSDVAHEGLKLSHDEKFILGSAKWEDKKPRVTASFDLPTFQRAFVKDKEIRVHANLAEGLELLMREAGGKLGLTYISRDGLTCHASVSPKAAPAIAEAALQYFQGVSLLDKGRLIRLTAAPESNAAFVTVDGTQLLADLEVAATDADGVLDYKFCFTPMALFYKRTKDQLISKKAYDHLVGETQTLPAIECQAIAGTFEQVGFPILKEKEDGHTFFKLRPGAKACALSLEVELRGTSEAWAHYQIVVTKNGKVETLKPQKQASSRLSIDCGQLGNATVKLEAVLRPTSDKPEDHPLPKPFQATYTYAPKLADFAAKKSPDGSQWVFTAKGECLSPPGYQADGAGLAGRKATDPNRVAQSLRLEFDPDVSNQGTRKLSDLVHYAYADETPVKKGPRKNQGFCDETGHFEATLSAVDAPAGSVKVKLVPSNGKTLPGVLPAKSTLDAELKE